MSLYHSLYLPFDFDVLPRMVQFKLSYKLLDCVKASDGHS